MGSKTRARELMAKAEVPIVPGTTEPVDTIEDARKVIEETIGYPVAVKAAGGGGGKGFRVALTEDKLKDAFEGAAREGEKFFSRPHRLPRALPARSRATSRSRCSPTRTATSSTSASATARSSAATRS